MDLKTINKIEGFTEKMQELDNNGNHKSVLIDISNKVLTIEDFKNYYIDVLNRWKAEDIEKTDLKTIKLFDDLIVEVKNI